MMIYSSPTPNHGQREEEMDTMQAFVMGQLAAGNELMVFDWDEAARRIVKSGAKNASAGLSGDWEWTGGDILRDGKLLSSDESYTYLASVWATPELDIDGDISPCFRMRSGTEWDADTRWPESALAILRGEA